MGRPRTGTEKEVKVAYRCSKSTRAKWKIIQAHHKTAEDAMLLYFDNYDKIISMLKSTPKGTGKLY